MLLISRVFTHNKARVSFETPQKSLGYPRHTHGGDFKHTPEPIRIVSFSYGSVCIFQNLTFYRKYVFTYVLSKLCPKLVPLPVIITTITQDEKHTTATDGSDGETSTARSNLVAAAIWQNMKKRTRNICHQSHKFFI